MKKNIIIAVIVLLLCSSLYVTFKREFDQFNPFYDKEVVYVLIDEPGKLETKYDRYRYNLTGYTEQGEKKKITFASSAELEQNSYVKVVAKGAYTYSWLKIKNEEVPDGALK